MQAPQRSQYFEMFGHRGFVSGDWKIVSPSRLNTWDISASGKLDNPWQLYNIKADPGEVKDLADADPARVGQLARGFEQQAERFHVNPIGDIRTAMAEAGRKSAADMRQRQGRWTYTGPISRIDNWSQPPIQQGGFTATAQVELATGTETGPLFVRGDHYGGTSFYLKDGKPKFFIKSLWGDVAELSAPDPVGPGRHEIALRFGKPSARPGQPAASDVAITVDGRTVASGRIAMSIPMTVPGGFDIGRDGATPVTGEYAANVDFPGKLDRLVFDFSGQD
jgi:arylsulfatase